MAQEFLEQLLLVENCVKINEDEALTCMVCLEPYQTLNASTGAVELQVRLPCKHLVGSVCIATWLQDNNSCPLCRATFFPAQPRPYLEHGLLDDVESPISEGYDTLDPEEICENLCEELDLDEEFKDISYRISALMSYRLREQVHSSECNAATSVYIAWHLLNTDIDDMVTDFLTDLSVAAHVGEDLILSTWRQFYPNRMEVIAPQVLPGLARPHMEDILALLPAPDADVRITNIHEGNHWGGSHTMNIGGFQVRECIQKAAIHEQLLGVLGDSVYSQVIQNLADQMYVEMDYDLRPTNRLISSWYGACVFMACHLMGKNISYSDVARVHGVSERSLREAYARVYPRRIDFIDYEITEIMGRENLERVLNALPALTWPPL